MAMVRQLTEGETEIESTPEDAQEEKNLEGSNGRPSSHCSSDGSKRSSPAILPNHQYSKDDLMNMSSYPLSQSWPSCLDPAYSNPTGKWDPERWFMNHRCERVAPLEESRPKRERADDAIVSHKRKTSDPKERIKEEKDDIVLSPQRRSFGTGCHVIQQSSLARRPGSPNDRDNDSFRDSSRRIGSGRIMTRDREQRDWERDRDYGYGSSRNDRRDRFDQEDIEKDNRRYSNRFSRNDRRSRGRDRIDEQLPEWMECGPTSQSETIELVGFEDSQNEDGRKANKKSKRAKQNSRRSSLKSEESEKVEVSNTEENAPASKATRPDTPKPKEEEKPPNVEESNDAKIKEAGFDLNHLLQMDWIPGLLPTETRPDNANAELGHSRFSQWFRRESPVLGMQESTNNSRRSSLHEELIANVLNSIGEPQLRIPSPTQNASSNFFAPISPALSHSPHYSMNQAERNSSASKDILEMLHSASANCDAAINGENSKKFDGKFKTVEELEADLKRIVLGGEKNKHEERSAFDKLVFHMSDSRSSPSLSMSMGPLDKSKALQEQDLLHDMMGSQQSISPVLQFKMMNDEKSAQQLLPCLSHPPFIQPPTQPQQKDIFAQMLQQQKQDQQHQQYQAQQQLHHIQQQQFQQQLQMQQQHHQQQQQQHHQQQQQAQSMNNMQGFTVDMLAKILGTAGQPPLSPTPGLHHHHHQQQQQQQQGQSFNRNEQQQTLNSVLQYQRQRELLANILKQQQQSNQNLPQQNILQQQQRRCPSVKEMATPQNLGLPLGLSPRQSPLPPEAMGSTIPSQGRIPSPLVFGQQPPALSHAPAPIHPAHLAQAMAQNAANANTLQVQNPVLQRVPSPQELAVHTQTILQNALIKRKLEEQKENFRKRTNSPVAPNKNGMTSTSPHKGLSPTIAFTPTSVMRKMQSEKVENKEQKISVNANGGKTSGTTDMRPTDPSQNTQKQGIPMPINSCDSNFVTSASQTPRPVHGQQGSSSQVRSLQSLMNALGPSLVVPGQGRPIVKVGSGQGLNINNGGMTKPAVTNKKSFMPSNHQSLHGEGDPNFEAMAKLPWQHQFNQRQQNAPAAMPALHTAAAYAALGHRPSTINPHHPNLLRPVAASPNGPTNFPIFRNVMQNSAIRAAPSNPVLQLNQMEQLAALQMRGVLGPRQLQALAQSQRVHPVTLQQLLLNAQNPVAAAQAQVGANLSAGRDGKHQHLLPGQPTTSNRQSPVNLTKWFGNDVLKQKMPDMPPVPHQKALLVEELERQQQQ